jgi:hypothetical protein
MQTILEQCWKVVENISFVKASKQHHITYFLQVLEEARRIVNDILVVFHITVLFCLLLFYYYLAATEFVSPSCGVFRRSVLGNILI